MTQTWRRPRRVFCGSRQHGTHRAGLGPLTRRRSTPHVLVLIMHYPTRVSDSCSAHNQRRQGDHMMKRFATTQLVIGLVLFLGSGNAVAGNGVGSLAKNKAYNVQIIAHDKCPAGSFDGTSRSSIAVLAGVTDSIANRTLLTGIEQTHKNFLAPGTNVSIIHTKECDGDCAPMEVPSGFG